MGNRQEQRQIHQKDKRREEQKQRWKQTHQKYKHRDRNRHREEQIKVQIADFTSI